MQHGHPRIIYRGVDGAGDLVDGTIDQLGKAFD